MLRNKHRPWTLHRCTSINNQSVQSHPWVPGREKKRPVAPGQNFLFLARPSLDSRHHSGPWLVVQPVRTPLVPGKYVTPGSVLISWSCSVTHTPVEPQQTSHETEVVNDRWDTERGSERGEGREKRWEEAEETAVRLTVSTEEVYSRQNR